MPSIVALDLESTGLDPEGDAILEIGAVKFDGKRVEAEWSTLINPGRRVPPFITQLTGITDNMVRSAPGIRDVVNDLAAFTGDAPILGQRIAFDLSFLRRHGLFQVNDVIDTYDVAAVMMPRAGRYNLGALGQQLNILFPATHRALDDARVTQAVYAQLYQFIREMPIELLSEIARLGEEQAWHGEWPFRQALRQRASEAVGVGRDTWVGRGPIYTRAAPNNIRPRQSELPEPKALDSEEVAALLRHGGVFSQKFDEFEQRSQQVEMLSAVTDALSIGKHLLVEAGTGTGKSLAYLLPAAMFALKNDTRVVISTNTINLQDQLIHKDIPAVQAAIGAEVSAAVLKGRNNYLCPRRLVALRRRGPESADELRVLAKVLVWLQDSENGDRGEINLNGMGERAVWSRISAADENCTTDTCVRRMAGICPFHRAYEAAQGAHLVVVNHALLLSDVATGSRILPDYQYLIVDEAHHIEAATTSALSYRLTQSETERIMRELGGTKIGQLGRLGVVGQNVLDSTRYGGLLVLIEEATTHAVQFQNKMLQVFVEVGKFLEEMREGRPVPDHTQQERIIESTRLQPDWVFVEVATMKALEELDPLLAALESINKGMQEIAATGEDEVEDLVSNIGISYRNLSDLKKQLDAFVFHPNPETVYWVEINPQRQYQISLQVAPLHVGDLMEKHIWHKKSSVILTSATLTAAGEFDYIKRRLNAQDADELALGSPFDYESATLLYLIEDIAEPNERVPYQVMLERGLVALAKATRGRTLALFTSYEQLRHTSQNIAAPLSQAGIQIFEQGEGASPHILLESFKASEAAVLLGTRAFWEGVDIPGDALSVVAIMRLPFEVPTDPLVAARSETFESPFYEYQVPEAILRFRQGFGRLIRTQSDRGVVAIFDKRVISKQYGSLFIDSLPQCTVKRGRMADLPRAAAQWLGM